MKALEDMEFPELVRPLKASLNGALASCLCVYNLFYRIYFSLKHETAYLIGELFFDIRSQLNILLKDDLIFIFDLYYS